MADTNTQVKFLKGHSSRLSTIAPQDGHFYLTEDTHKLYAGIGSGDSAILALLNHDITFVNKVADLTTETHSTDQLYYAKDENVLAIYNETAGEFVQINPDDGATSVAFTGEGAALTGVTYDAITRTLTFTRGNISADAVKTTKMIKVTTKVGNYAVGKEISTDTDIQTLLLNMLCADVQPTKTDPSNSITLKVGGNNVTASDYNSYEVGTTINPSYSVGNNIGRYTANGVTQASGVTVNSTTVTQSGRPDSVTTGASDTTGKTSLSGNLTSFVIQDGTVYKLTVSTSFSDGAIPKTYLGEDAPSKQIKAQTDTVSSHSISSYRSWFLGGDSATTLTSADIRALDNKGKPAATKVYAKASDYSGCKRFIIAIPVDSGINLSSVFMGDENAQGANITSEFKKQTTAVNVEGKDGYSTTKAYNVWVYQPAVLDSSEKYVISIA